MQDIYAVSIDDPRYPAQLKQIKDPPKMLYARGILPGSGEVCIGMVGTRRPSAYGQRVALRIAGELAEAGATVVSGMAPGIDTFAHQSCVERNKRTVAVLGTGIDEPSIYPQQNLNLSRKIVACGGCLISELPPGSHGASYTFPRRNRIIAALSKAVVVVEAKEQSGSLITADYARQQQKKLFAVPGDIFTQNAAGPHQLIKEGAMLATGANDILEALHLPPGARQAALLAENPEEAAIMGILKENQAHIDEIIKQTRLPAPAVSATLALLEISGKIRNLGGNIYALP